MASVADGGRGAPGAGRGGGPLQEDRCGQVPRGVGGGRPEVPPPLQRRGQASLVHLRLLGHSGELRRPYKTHVITNAACLPVDIQLLRCLPAE